MLRIKMKKRLWQAAVILSLAFSAVFFYQLSTGGFEFPEPVASPTQTPFTYSDPYFQQMAERLSMPPEGVAIYQRANPVFSAAFKAGVSDTKGEYSDGQIKIAPGYSGRTDQEPVALIAHEYLHAAWYETPQEYRDTVLKPQIRAFYAKYKANFDRRLEGYAITTDEQLMSELHSFMGTEVADSVLPPELLRWYQRWLPNRDVLPSYFVG